MVNKYSIITFLIGLVFGIISMVLLRKSEPDQKPETKVYDVANNRLKERIKSDSVLIVKLKKNVRVEIREIEKIKIKYVPFQNEINRGNPVQLDSMFNIILSE